MREETDFEMYVSQPNLSLVPLIQRYRVREGKGLTNQVMKGVRLKEKEVEEVVLPSSSSVGPTESLTEYCMYTCSWFRFVLFFSSWSPGLSLQSLCL